MSAFLTILNTATTNDYKGTAMPHLFFPPIWTYAPNRSWSPQPHRLPSTCRGRRMPAEWELIDLTHATLMSICSKRVNMQPQITCRDLFSMLKMNSWKKEEKIKIFFFCVRRKLIGDNEATNWEKYNAFIWQQQRHTFKVQICAYMHKVQ